MIEAPDGAVTLAAGGTSCRFEPAMGTLTELSVTDGGREMRPLHRAPLGRDPGGHAAGRAPHLAVLGGDFLCAPFGGREGTSPLHGWPANAAWEVTKLGPATLTARLTRRVMGAMLTKTLTLLDGHPFVYQRHAFEGGAGELAVANHANVSVIGGAEIRTSPKSDWVTPPEPLEGDPAQGRSALRYPARGRAEAFPGMDGPIDLQRVPWAPAHDDLVCGIEAPGHALAGRR